MVLVILYLLARWLCWVWGCRKSRFTYDVSSQDGQGGPTERKTPSIVRNSPKLEVSFPLILEMLARVPCSRTVKTQRAIVSLKALCGKNIPQPRQGVFCLGSASCLSSPGAEGAKACYLAVETESEMLFRLGPWSWLIHLFTLWTSTEHLWCSRHHPRHWGYRNGHPLGTAE